MPGRQTHLFGGLVAAVAVDVLAPPDLPESDRFWHGVGAALGGASGGVLPDVLEPASDPNHRQFCHGLLPNLAIWYLSRGQYEEGHKQFLNWACEATGDFLLPEMYEGGRGLPRWLRMLIAGFIRGLPLGYLSHLVMDLLPPRSLPLVGSLDRLLRPATGSAGSKPRRRCRSSRAIRPR